MAAKTAAEKNQEKLVNIQAQQLAAQVAQWAAALDFQKERFRLLEMPEFQFKSQLEIDKLAWEKAQGAVENNYKEALLTGQFQGKPTTQWLMDQAKMTGSFNGELTLEGRLTDAQIQDMHDKMKLANDEFLSSTTGYFNGVKTFDRQKFEAAQAMDGWKFISSLSGAQNAFKQARAIQNAPAGLPDIMGAFAGQYMVGSGGAVGSGGSGYGAGALDDMMLGFKGMQNYQYPQYGQGFQQPGGPSAAPLGLPISTPPPPPPPPAPSQPSPSAAANQYAIQQYMLENPGSTSDQATTWLTSLARPDQRAGMEQRGFATYGTAAAYDAGSANSSVVRQFMLENPGTTSQQAINWISLSATPEQRAAMEQRGIASFGAGGSAFVPITMPTESPMAAPVTATSTSTGYTYSPPGVQAPTQAYNYSQNMSGSVGVYPPGVASPYQTADISSTAPIAPGAAAAALTPAPAYQYGAGVTAPQTTSTPLLAPNKINSLNYANLYDYQKDIGWAGYEDAGYDKGLSQESFARSKPTFGGPTKGSVAF